MERKVNKYHCPLHIKDMEECVKVLRMTFHPNYVSASRPGQVTDYMHAYIYVVSTPGKKDEVQIIFSRDQPTATNLATCVASLNSYHELVGLPLMNHGYNLGRENE